MVCTAWWYQMVFVQGVYFYPIQSNFSLFALTVKSAPHKTTIFKLGAMLDKSQKIQTWDWCVKYTSWVDPSNIKFTLKWSPGIKRISRLIAGIKTMCFRVLPDKASIECLLWRPFVLPIGAKHLTAFQTKHANCFTRLLKQISATAFETVYFIGNSLLLVEIKRFCVVQYISGSTFVQCLFSFPFCKDELFWIWLTCLM